jgi:hypothetical protein
MVTVYKYLSIVPETLLSVVHRYDTITNRTDHTEKMQTVDGEVERKWYVRILHD